ARRCELRQEGFRRACTAATAFALTAPLHGGNLQWPGVPLAVFDFAVRGLGVPALDLAISTFYLRGGEAGAEEAMRAGYASVAHLPDVDRSDFEAMVASRQLLLANAILSSSTGQLRAMASTYLPTTVDRLRHWLEHGTFTRALPG